MCGIVGVLDPQRTTSADDTSVLLRRMAEPNTSRGPDGEVTTARKSGLNLSD